MIVTVEAIYFLLMLLFSAVAGAGVVVVALVGTAWGIGKVIGRALDAAELSAGAPQGAIPAPISPSPDDAGELSGGTVTLPPGSAPRVAPRPPCAFCQRIRKGLKRIF
jgi:hypothetical protein